MKPKTYYWIIRYKLRQASRQAAPFLVFCTLPACCTGILSFFTKTFLVGQIAIIALFAVKLSNMKKDKSKDVPLDYWE